ncbi:helix-turn-helix transcriptional regulator [Streptomyces sp. NPDC088124]|uniref:helix-turn-helix domain-containing protein n=1 Tax=Streptomyces sp. NPDC088124 TaxID=3154654 RepID=UPI0034148C18
MDALDAAVAGDDDLGAVVRSIDELLTALQLSWDAIVDLESLSRRAGLPLDRIRDLIDGDVPNSETSDPFLDRFTFLRETRRRKDGKRLSYGEIAQGAGMSHGQVGYLLNGQRSPGHVQVQKLEKYFKVPPGFFSASDSEALCRELRPVHEDLNYLALLKGKGISHLAMRRSGSPENPNNILAVELREALTIAMSSPVRDSDMEELRRTMGSLSSQKRKTVLNKIRGMLSRAQSEDQGNEGAGRISD